MAKYIVRSALILSRTGEYFREGAELEVGRNVLQEEIKKIYALRDGIIEAVDPKEKSNDEAAKDPQDDKTVAQIKETLTERGVSFSKKAKRAELLELLGDSHGAD